ncbi:Uncharacterised protein [uncultured archaeon]|nr:Uncharacterised protein [uncultured archaeon]
MLFPDCLETISFVDTLEASVASIILFDCGFLSYVSKLRKQLQQKCEKTIINSNFDERFVANLDLSEQFIERWSNRINWLCLCCNPNISDDFLVLNHASIEKAYNDLYHFGRTEITNKNIQIVRFSLTTSDYLRFQPDISPYWTTDCRECKEYKEYKRRESEMSDFMSYLRTPVVVYSQRILPSHDILRCMGLHDDVYNSIVSCIVFDAIMFDDIDIRLSSIFGFVELDYDYNDQDYYQIYYNNMFRAQPIPWIRRYYKNADKSLEFKIYLDIYRYEVIDDEFCETPNMTIDALDYEDGKFLDCCLNELIRGSDNSAY